MLQLGNKQYVRLQNRGKTTPAGRFYFSQTDSQPQTFDLIGNVIQRGSTEYLLTNGKLRVLRRLSGSDYIYTRLGTQYFSAKQASYLVHAPALIKKAHNNSIGRQFMVPHNAFMNTDLTVGQNLSKGERETQLKNKVLAALEDLERTSDGSIILYNDSDPVIYDPQNTDVRRTDHGH